MSLVDEIQIYARAGRGGDGVVRWRQEKFIDRGGPAGGDGGKGGDVYVVGIRDNNLLASYRHQKEFIGNDGAPGGKKKQHGESGEDLMIKLPIGSRITNISDGKEYFLEKENQEIRILEGGNGGFGNDHFKSSINVTPTKATPGKDGEEGTFKIELELFADLGLIGLPNAGKSSLLNSVTNAKSKIGSYQFTTLDPHLGDFYGHVIADIPGLIEGASEGKGLGIKFLKHIKRTRLLAHLISFENDKPMTVYKQIRKELAQYGNGLDQKEEIIVLTKTDLVDGKTIEKTIKEFEKKTGNVVLTLSLYDDGSIKRFSDALIKILTK